MGIKPKIYRPSRPYHLACQTSPQHQPTTATPSHQRPNRPDRLRHRYQLQPRLSRRIPTHPQRLGRPLNHPDTPGKRHTKCYLAPKCYLALKQATTRRDRTHILGINSKEYPPGRPGDDRERKIMLVVELLNMIISLSIAIVAWLTWWDKHKK